MAAKSIPVATTIPPINQPVIDRSSGLMSEAWYRFLETLRDRTGGDDDLVDGTKVAASVAQDGADQANDDVNNLRQNTIIAGIGLDGGGAIGDGVLIDAKQDTGWTPATGISDKATAFAVHVGQVISNPPTQAEVQALDDALVELGARYLALEEALLANESIAP